MRKKYLMILFLITVMFSVFLRPTILNSFSEHEYGKHNSLPETKRKNVPLSYTYPNSTERIESNSYGNNHLITTIDDPKEINHYMRQHNLPTSNKIKKIEIIKPAKH